MMRVSALVLIAAVPVRCRHEVTLTYFPVAARGELARLLAAAGGLAIVDSTDTTNYTATPFGFLPMLADPGAGLILQESLAIERYISAIAPQFSQLTPAQRAVDDEFACAKEDLMAVETCAVNVPAARECVPRLFDRYLGILEKLIPRSTGFVHGLPFPTGADLAVLVITKSGFPWGRGMRLAGYTDQWPRRFPKVAALAERTAAAPAVAAYLATSATFYAKLEPTGGVMIDPPAAVHATALAVAERGLRAAGATTVAVADAILLADAAILLALVAAAVAAPVRSRLRRHLHRGRAAACAIHSVVPGETELDDDGADAEAYRSMPAA